MVALCCGRRQQCRARRTMRDMAVTGDFSDRFVILAHGHMYVQGAAPFFRIIPFLQRLISGLGSGALSHLRRSH